MLQGRELLKEGANLGLEKEKVCMHIDVLELDLSVSAVVVSILSIAHLA